MISNDLKNVVIVNDFDYVQGGASKVAIDTANLLANKNINVYFFSGDSNRDSKLDKNIIKICTNQGEALKNKNKIKGTINGIYNFKAKLELKRLLKTLNREETLIHIHGWTKCLSSSVFDIAFKMNFKVVLTLHDYFTACPNGGYFNYKKNEICYLKPMTGKCIKCNCDSRNYAFKLYRVLRQFVQNKVVKLNRRLTDVITISNFSEKILKKNLNDKVKIHRVYNPIELTKNNDNSANRENYYLYVGRISKEKGVDIFCEAITGLNLKGIVVGDGSEKSNLEKKYSNIEFAGWKNSREVQEYMQKAKALIFPSKWYEGAPLTILEAFSVGLPCIVSKKCAAVDFIENEENGLIYDGSIDDLEKRLKQYESLDFKLLSKKVHKKYWKKPFDKKMYFDSLIGVYNKIM